MDCRFHENAFDNVVCKIAAILFRPQYDNWQVMEFYLSGPRIIT